MKSIPLIFFRLAIFLALIAAGATSRADTKIASITTGSSAAFFAPASIVVNATSGKFYVANNSAKSATVFDPKLNVLNLVGLSGSGRFVALNPNNGNVYIAESGSNVVQIIDGNSNALLINPNAVPLSIPLASPPTAMLVDAPLNKVFVASSGTSGSVTIIDAAANTVSGTLAMPFASALGLDANAQRVYVASSGSNANKVSIIDATSNQFVTISGTTTPVSIPVGPAPIGIAVSESNGHVYVANSGTNSVSVISGTTVASTIVLSGTPSAILSAIVSGSNLIFVGTDDGSGHVQMIDSSSDTIAATVSIGRFPSALAYDSGKLFSANYGSDTISIISTASNNAVSSVTLPGNSGPVALAVDGSTGALFVTNRSGNSVVEIKDTSIAGIFWSLQKQVAIATNPITHKTYVVDQGGNLVKVINGVTLSGTIPVGVLPGAIALNLNTNKIYVANTGANSVSVIDGATSAVSTIPVGAAPAALIVNPQTNQIYVANSGTNTVSILDGVSSALTTVGVGPAPASLAFNPVTSKIFVGNSGTNTVSVIDSANNVSTLAVSGTPGALAVNAVTNKLYVANSGTNIVNEIDGANNVSAISVPGRPGALAVNAVTNKIFVLDTGSNALVAIDGVTKSTATFSLPATPTTLGVNSLTNKVYVGGTTAALTVFDGNTNTASTVTIDAPASALSADLVNNYAFVATGTSPLVSVVEGSTNPFISIPLPSQTTGDVNPVTNKIYLALSGSNALGILDGATNATSILPLGFLPNAVAVNPLTNKIFVSGSSANSVAVIDGTSFEINTIPTGSTPVALAVNPATNKIYVANFADDNVTILDATTNTTGTLTVGTGPIAVAVNPVTNKIYVAGFYGGNVAAIDGASDAFSLVPVGQFPVALAVNSQSNKIYVANSGGNSVSVIDGATNATATINVGANPQALAVNQITNKIYVANSGSNSVTVIDGATNGTLSISLAFSPGDVAVNPATNKIYVSGTGASGGAIIDGQTNTVLTGSAAFWGALVNAATGNVYGLTNTNSLLVIHSNTPQPEPLVTAIDALPEGLSFRDTVTFDLSALSNFSPGVPPIERTYFQIDTLGGAWSAASNGKAFVGGLKPGAHVIYAFSTDAQGAGTIDFAPGTTLPLGSIAAYPFFTEPNFFSGKYIGGIVGDTTGHSGVITLSVLNTGAFTGTLRYGGRNFTLRGTFDGAGYFQTTIARGKNLSPLLVTLTLQQVNGIEVVGGNVFDGSFVAQIDSGRVVFSKTNPAPQAGQYTVVIPPDPTQTNGATAPQGSGAATLNVQPTGAMRFAGTLADGTVFSQGATLTRGGIWFLNLPLYGKKGVLEGKITFENVPAISDLDGPVKWIKPASGSAFYPNGFTLNSTLIGSIFDPTAPPLFTGTQHGTFHASSGNLLAPIDDMSVHISGTTKTTLKLSGSNNLSLTIRGASGVITGSFKHPNTHATTPVHAVVFQKQDRADGNFESKKAGSNQAGAVQLTQP